MRPSENFYGAEVVVADQSEEKINDGTLEHSYVALNAEDTQAMHSNETVKRNSVNEIDAA